MFSANLGFLYTDLPLTERIYAAYHDGFSAVECHFPFDTPASELRAALEDTGLRMLGLNTFPGNVATGEFGLCAVPGRQAEARTAIDQAVEYGAAIGATNVHVMAGRTKSSDEAQAVFKENLQYACNLAIRQNMTILIEPINQHDVPGYFLTSTEHARDILDTLELENLRLMFDCYHIKKTKGDPSKQLRDHMPVIGHVQIAAVPDRGEPDQGEIDYISLIREIRALGFNGPIGAEYRPRSGSTRDGIGWLSAFKKELT